MASELTLLKQPIAICPEHIASGITILRFQSTGRIGDGNPASWSQHRYFHDASGLPLFELRRKPTGVTWFVEMPGGSSQPLATLAPRWVGLKDKCDVFVANAAAQGEEAVLEVRGQDIWKRRTHIYCNGALVMRVKLVNMVSVYPGETA